MLALHFNVELVPPLDGGLVADVILAMFYAAACSGATLQIEKFPYVSSINFLIIVLLYG